MDVETFFCLKFKYNKRDWDKKATSKREIENDIKRESEKHTHTQ